MCQQKSNNFSRLYPGGAGGEGKLQVILNIIHINFNVSTEVKHLQRTLVELVVKELGGAQFGQLQTHVHTNGLVVDGGHWSSVGGE